MRTPILTIIFFIKLIMETLSSSPLNLAQIPQSLKYCTLIMSQSELLQSYVDDLLDLRMLQTGRFSLTNAPFDIVETVKQIQNIFRP